MSAEEKTWINIKLKSKEEKSCQNETRLDRRVFTLCQVR